MSQEYIEPRGSSAVELARVDCILNELARPTLDEDSIPPATRAAVTTVHRDRQVGAAGDKG